MGMRFDNFGSIESNPRKLPLRVLTPPAIISSTSTGFTRFKPFPGNITQCPDTHYQCPGDGYCLPVFARCNSINNCPGHEDEAGCGVYTCAGLYRCRGRDRTICLHGEHLCDGLDQCPLQDDELMCKMSEVCPDHCVCYGTHVFRSEAVLHLRYLEGRGTGLTSDLIASFSMLIHLGVVACGWTNVADLKMINLHVLDVSDNLLQTVNFEHIAQLLNLKELVLVGNPLSTSFSFGGRGKLRTLLFLNLSRVPHQYSNLHVFSDSMPQVQVLDLSQTGLTSRKGNRMYAGSYLFKEITWKRSTVCHIAGFLSLLSCEVSSFLICLITLDRLLVIRFPFSRLRFGVTSAHVACGVIWALGLILASVPLLPVTSHWAFYSQTGICIPLPVTRTNFPGRDYSFAVMIVVNLVMFLLIAVGQAFIFWSVKINTMSMDAPKSKDDVTVKDKTRSKEFTIARRLLVIAMSDFLCWFPIGLCGLLTKLDIPVPGEVNAAMATIVLPVNAALNPFLYTYTILRRKRQKEKEANLQKFIIAQIKTMNRLDRTG
ncbi:hypothetical protein ACOMHN_018045 [Nucella lapillus]